MTEPNSDHPETPAEHDDAPPEDYALGPMMIVMAWRAGDTTSTIDDALRDGPRIVGEIAAEVAAERELPRDWLARFGAALAALPEDDS